MAGKVEEYLVDEDNSNKIRVSELYREEKETVTDDNTGESDEPPPGKRKTDIGKGVSGKK